MKVVCDNKIPFLGGALEPYAEVVYLPGAKICKDDLMDADALITRTRTICNAELLDGTSVKFIATATIGFDHIDTDYCASNDIVWTNAPGCNSSSVAQYMASVLLTLAVRRSLSLRGKTLGVIGVGNVGAKVAKVGEALGMRVLLNDPPRAREEGHENFVDLKQIIEESDFITCHVPLNREGEDKTFHLVDEGFVDEMKHSAILINSSRGPVVDNKVLKDALAEKTIAGAVLDVWEGEPDIDLELLEMVDMGTPHIAGYSADGKATGTSMSVNSLSEFFGLGFKDWFPENVPLPNETEIILENDRSFEELMYEVISFTYEVDADSLLLKTSPDTFENQRADYPLRREFPVFNVKCDKPEIIEALSLLGFKVSAG